MVVCISEFTPPCLYWDFSLRTENWPIAAHCLHCRVRANISNICLCIKIMLTLLGRDKLIQEMFLHPKLRTYNHFYLFNRETTCSLAKQFNCYVFEMRTNEEVNLKLSFYPSNITLSIILSDNQNIYSNINNNIGPYIHEQFCSKVFFPNFS